MGGGDSEITSSYRAHSESSARISIRGEFAARPGATGSTPSRVIASSVAWIGAIPRVALARAMSLSCRTARAAQRFVPALGRSQIAYPPSVRHAPAHHRVGAFARSRGRRPSGDATRDPRAARIRRAARRMLDRGPPWDAPRLPPGRVARGGPRRRGWAACAATTRFQRPCRAIQASLAMRASRQERSPGAPEEGGGRDLGLRGGHHLRIRQPERPRSGSAHLRRDRSDAIAQLSARSNRSCVRAFCPG